MANGGARAGPWKRRAQTVVVRALCARAQRGELLVAGLRLPCALGRAGRRAGKREGDGATPIGCWPVREVLYRRDRSLPPATRLRVRAIRPDDGWCDESRDRNYNRRVRHPYPASAERLARDDRLYDVVIVLGYNDRPRIRGRGSAIFMHVAQPGLAPTAGCIALSQRDLALVLGRIGPGTQVVVP